MRNMYSSVLLSNLPKIPFDTNKILTKIIGLCFPIFNEYASDYSIMVLHSII